MPQERITLTLGPLSSSLTSHATHLSLTTSTISSPYDPSKLLRLVDDKNVLRIRGVIVDEKGSFIDYTTPEENLEDTSSAWTGATSIFDMTDNESMNANALRSSLMPQTTDPGSFFDLKPAQPEKSIPSKGREVDWDAYMEEDTNPQVQEEESTQQLGHWSDFESALESCGGISGIKSWISYHPIPSPLYVPMPTFNLVRDGKDSVFSCTEVEEVEESVRKLLEECDSVSEIDLNITHDDKNYYWLGMSSKILQFISEETRRSYITTTVSCGKLENEEEEVVGEIMRENRRDVRRAVNVGVGLNGVREFSDVIIPVDYSKCEEMLQSSQTQNVGEINCVSKPRLIKTNIFTAGAVAGLVIDSAFSSTNLKTNHAGGGVTVAGAGISGDGGEINATRMGKSEMGNVVKPSYRHKIVELEGGWISGREFKNIIKGEGEGGDERIRGGVKEGEREYTIKKLLKPLGGIDGGEEGKFFGISGAARFDASFGTSLDTRRDLVKALYSSTSASRIAATIVSSNDIGSPNVGGLNLGSYWKLLLGERGGENNTMFTTLSTSTRSKGWLTAVAENLNKARVGTLCDGARGFLTSEIARGACCEPEELVEVVEDLRQLVDVYDEE